MKDYRERTVVSKNRPRKSGGGLYAKLIILTSLISFTVGLGTGWFFFRLRPASSGVAQSQAGTAKTSASPAPQGQTPVPASTPAGNSTSKTDPALTFYETLPKGGKVPLGSGINPVKKDIAAAVPPAAAVVHQQPAQQLPAESAKSVAPSASPSAARQGKYTVQVASCQTRKEAEDLRGRLVSKGLDAFISESTIAGKGVWFRVRIGRHLEHEAAREVSIKAGKGAMVIPE